MADSDVKNNTLPKSLRILCFGDSLTAGYTRYGWEFHPYADHLRVGLQHMLSTSDVEIEVAGLSGDQVVQGSYLPRIKAKCANTETPFDWIIIMGGTNDLGYGQSPDKIYEGLQKVWKVALDTGANVLALNVLEAAFSGGKDPKRSSLNSKILNHQQERYYAFDLYSAIRYTGINEDLREKLWDDGLHLTSEGYKVMGDVIAVRMFELLKTVQQPKKIGPASN